jgi:divalent metal cation (Fe/Co/Zn/Cd) transporter
MKAIFSLLLLLTATAARAHPSLVPHHHPHGVSMLPDLGTFIVGGIFLMAVALVAFAQLTRR